MISAPYPKASRNGTSSSSSPSQSEGGLGGAASGVAAPTLLHRHDLRESPGRDSFLDPLGGQVVVPDIGATLIRRRGSGEPLPAKCAAELGAGLGADLSSVRVHADDEAAQLSDRLQADAFAYGQDLYFAQGAFCPSSSLGRELLAHELAHVLQGSTAEGTSAEGTYSAPIVGRANDPAERAADNLAAAALKNVPAGTPKATSRVSSTRALDAIPRSTIRRTMAVPREQGLAELVRWSQPNETWGPGASADDYWRKYGDRLMEMWGRKGLMPPTSVLERIQECIDADRLIEVSQLTKDVEIASEHQSLSSEAASLTWEREAEAYRVPSILHFYWAGRKIPPGKLDILDQWASRASNSDWKIWVWHDGAVSEARDSGQLSNKITVMKITSAAIDPRLRAQYESLIKPPNPVYPAASDLVRYSILLRYGGVYADVDTGPGDMDFSKPLVINSSLPIQFAPGLRDAEAVRGEIAMERARINQDSPAAQKEVDIVPEQASVAGEDGSESKAKTPVTKDQVAEAVRLQRKYGASPGTNLIVTPPRSKIMDWIVAECVAALGKVPPEEMSGSQAAATGPLLVATALGKSWEKIRNEYLIDELPPDASKGQTVQAIFANAISDLPLDWVTDESEDQAER